MSKWKFTRVSDDSYEAEGDGKRYRMTFWNVKLNALTNVTNPDKPKELRTTGALAKELSAALGQELRHRRAQIETQRDAARSAKGRWTIKIQHSPGLHLYLATDTYNDRVYRAYLNDDCEITRLVNVTHSDKHRELDPRGHTAYLIKSAMRKRSSGRIVP